MIRILFLITFLLNHLCLSQTAWIQQQSNTTSNLNSIYSATGDLAWAVGNNATIIQTTNGGTLWSSISFQRSTVPNSSVHLTAVWGFDVNTILVSGYVKSPLDSSAGFIMRTSNGGVTWQEVFRRNYKQINQLYFTSSTLGFASTARSSFGDHQYILRTTDKGLHWTVHKEFTLGSFGLISCWFPDSTSYGYAIKLGSEPYYYYRAYNITNSTVVELHPTDTTASPILNVAWCSDSSFLMDTFKNWNKAGYKRILYSTTNNGTTWKELPSTPSLLGQSSSYSSPALYVSGLKYSTDSLKIFKTTDLGSTWITQSHPPLSASINYIHASSPPIAFAVGDTGTILKTTGGGVTSVTELDNSQAGIQLHLSGGLLTIPATANQVTLFTIQGSQVLHCSTPVPQLLDIHHLPNGVYIVAIRTGIHNTATLIHVLH